jgi:hypothetical protein
MPRTSVRSKHKVESKIECIIYCLFGFRALIKVGVINKTLCRDEIERRLILTVEGGR